MNVTLVVMPGAFDLGLSAALDTLEATNELAGSMDSPPPPLEISLVSTRCRVRRCLHEYVRACRQCVDGHGATTSWWLAPLFRQRYLRIGLDESRMLVSSGSFVTAGAALAHVDLALDLVRRHSPGLAALTARYLLVEPRASQVIPDHLAHSDPVVERFERWARQHIKQGFSLAGAARSVGTSERTLARRLRAVLGKSLLSYFQDLRVERAVHLLQTSKITLERIAARSGTPTG